MATALLAVLMTSAGAFAQQKPDLTIQARKVDPASVTGDLLDIGKIYDGRLETRATSGKADYTGMSYTLDAGAQQNIIGVYQVGGRWPTFYPGRYKVEVANSTSGPWMWAWEGPGERGTSSALFPAIRARFLRVTATKTGGGNNEWSVAEVQLAIDPAAKNPRDIPAQDRGDDRTPERPGPARVTGDLKDIDKALDKNQETRATSGTANYSGMSVLYDLGGEYDISRVVQVHGQWPDDFPAEYKIEASRRKDESQFRQVWSGRGTSGRSEAQFNEITTRYIRITATRNQDRTHWWSIAELRTNRDNDVTDRDEDDKRLEREIRRIRGNGFSNLTASIDGNQSTYASTNTNNYIGNWVILDLGGSYTISKLVQVHAPNDREFPGRYKIEVSEDGNRWQAVFEGEGGNTRSRATFTPVRARYVRVTATDNRGNRSKWSISKFRILE